MVKDLQQTHYMFAQTIKVAKIVDAILEKHGLTNCIFSEIVDPMKFERKLTWRFGSPKVEFFVFTPNRQYLDRENPFLHAWKECDIDPMITGRFGTKYSEGNVIMELPERYNLFLMQDNMNKELDHFSDAVEYAKTHKVYTVFKQHPLTKITVPQSEYVIFVDGSHNLSHLLDGADKVSSSYSSVSVNAMIRGKVCASYDTTPFSEILPKIKTARELEDMQPVNQDDLKRFLSWYAHKLCIDVTQEDFEERIEQRIVDFN
jgi:hypothetical protein